MTLDEAAAGATAFLQPDAGGARVAVIDQVGTLRAGPVVLHRDRG